MKNLKLIFSLSFVFISFLAIAQYDQSKINKKALEAYAKGIEKAEEGKYKDAVEKFLEAIERDSKYIDAYLSVAGVFGQLKEHHKSIEYYEKAFALDSNYTSDYRLPYSINLAGLGEFEKALQSINNLLAHPGISSNTKKAAEYRKKTYEFALEHKKQFPEGDYVFAPRNLGAGINSPESEYFPSMPVDGQQLIFTRRLGNYNEDFFGSFRNGNLWENAVRLNGSINTGQNEGAQNISQDGNWLIFTGCNREDGFGSCDLYISYLTNDGWSEAINLGKNINSQDWESQPSLSPDKPSVFTTKGQRHPLFF